MWTLKITCQEPIEKNNNLISQQNRLLSWLQPRKDFQIDLILNCPILPTKVNK